jgi:hypothetical protein
MRQQKKRASGLSPPGQALAAIQEVSAKTAQLHCSIRGWATQPLASLAQSPILTVVKARLRPLFIIGEKCGLEREIDPKILHPHPNLRFDARHPR